MLRLQNYVVRGKALHSEIYNRNNAGDTVLTTIFVYVKVIVTMYRLHSNFMVENMES
jgi:hypothetical protein